jgi:outer membrane autotransporter protein
MRKLFMLGSLIALLVPTASHAFQLGIRLGYAPAMGDEQKDAPMSDFVKSQIPIQVDGLFAVNKDFALGPYFSYGVGQLNSDVKDGCDLLGVDCSVSNVRLGLEGIYKFNSVQAQMVPWLGAGLGYEASSITMSAGGVSASADTSGLELNLQAGGDFKVNEQFSVGPYVQLSIGRYSNFEGNSIDEKGVHQWLGFGIAGKFGL